MKNLDLDIFTVKKSKLKPAKGRVLIAEPLLQGAYFSRSIIFLAEYNESGAVGFVLNKSSELYPDEIIDDLFSFKGELYLGGPVSADTLHFIHTLGERIPDSIQITDKLFWGGNFDSIKNLINKDEIDYSMVKFFAGYSGWSPGQLEQEIEENSWIVATLDDLMIMNTDTDDIWRNTVEKLGEEFKPWCNFPENPSFN